MHNVLRLMLAKKRAQKTQEQREKDGEKIVKDLQDSIKNAIIRL